MEHAEEAIVCMPFADIVPTRANQAMRDSIRDRAQACRITHYQKAGSKAVSEVFNNDFHCSEFDEMANLNEEAVRQAVDEGYDLLDLLVQRAMKINVSTFVIPGLRMYQCYSPLSRVLMFLKYWLSSQICRAHCRTSHQESIYRRLEYGTDGRIQLMPDIRCHGRSVNIWGIVDQATRLKSTVARMYLKGIQVRAPRSFFGLRALYL
jgi:hypothetical protein